MATNIAELRHSYTLGGLNEATMSADAMTEFQQWLEQAIAANLTSEPNAMTLATASPDGKPSARIMLLKAADERGFLFFTNYESRKGGELEANPCAALVFFWAELERQIRVEGELAKISREETEGYFKNRPFASRIGAWASAQSSVVESREALDARFDALAAQYADGEVPAPPHWGGYRLTPERLEFWQGRQGRMHDRVAYTKTADGWRKERLAP